MKHNFLFVAMLLGAMTFLASCKGKDFADPVDVANEMSVAKFEGTATRSQVTVVDGTMRIQQWDFTDKTPKTLTYTYAEWGDGTPAYYATPIEYNYERIGLAEKNLGVNYIFAQVDDPTNIFPVLYWGNGFVIEGDSVLETGDKLVNFRSVTESFPNHDWVCELMTDSMAIDTLNWDSVYVKNVKKWDEEHGKWILIKDTIVDTIAHVVKTKLGPLTYRKLSYSFERTAGSENYYDFTDYDSVYVYNEVIRHLDSTLNEKLGHKYYTYKVTYDVDREQGQYRLNEQIIDGRWYLNTITSGSRFALVGENNRNLSISAFSLDKKTTKIGNEEYKLVEK